MRIFQINAVLPNTSPRLDETFEFHENQRALGYYEN